MCLRSEASRLTAAHRALALVVCRSYAVAMVASEWGKNGEAVAAEMNEWFSDDVLVWQDTPRGEAHAGTKTAGNYGGDDGDSNCETKGNLSLSSML